MKISVSLEAQTWKDVVHFITGDTQNMDPDCEARQQMEKVCEVISNTVTLKEWQAEQQKEPAP